MKTYNGQFMPEFLRITGTVNVKHGDNSEIEDRYYKHESDPFEEYRLLLRENMKDEN